MSETVAPIEFSCERCGGRIQAAPEWAGQQASCPHCQQVIRIPDAASPAATVPQRAQPSTSNERLCAICQSPMRADEAKTSCPGCRAEYHQDCWSENGGCAIYGCSEVPKTEGRTSVEIPVGYWGQENKPCPVCGQSILAAAVRCRHCGSVFQTARPLDSNEFSQSAALEARAPGLRRRVIWLFVLSLLPFSAPVATIVLYFWSHSNRPGIEKLTSLYSALVTVGLIVGAVETCGMVLVALLYASLHH